MTLTPSSPSQRPRSKEYHSGLTREFLVLFCANLVFAALIIYYGVDINRTWHGRGNLFVMAGLGVVGFALYLLSRVFGKTVVMTPRAIVYRCGQRETVMLWQDLRTVQTSRPGKRWFRTALVGDHSRMVTIESSAFPQYDVIVSLITVTRRQSRERGYEIGG